MTPQEEAIYNDSVEPGSGEENIDDAELLNILMGGAE